MATLLPCLKCAEPEGQTYANDGWFGVECCNCMHTTGAVHRSADAAIAAWNAGRTPAPPTTGHDPKLVAALASLVKRLEATPEELRGPFLVHGLKPYLPSQSLRSQAGVKSDTPFGHEYVEGVKISALTAAPQGETK